MTTTVTEFLLLALVGYTIACFFLHRCVWHTGKPVLVHHAVSSSCNECNFAASETSRTVTYTALSGDLGSALVAREIFDERVYFKHGVSLARTGATAAVNTAPPLVIDIGCNIGLFALSASMECPGAVVIGAEPVPALYSLALQNTAGARGRVHIENMGIAPTHEEGVTVVVDPRITAGTSLCAGDIVRPMIMCHPCTQLQAIAHDLLLSGCLPRFPTLHVCHGLSIPYVRYMVLAVTTPILLLFAIYFLVAPNGKHTVACTVGTMTELIAKASESSELDHFVRRRLHEGPIDLVKVDVEGAEWGVLQSITDSQWRRIEQIVVEVHDICGMLLHVRQLLENKGFTHIMVDQEEWLSHGLLRIFTVYATRIHPA